MLLDKKRHNRPKVTTPADDRQIITTSKRDRRKTAPKITVETNYGRRTLITISTVQRRFRKGDLFV